MNFASSLGFWVKNIEIPWSWFVSPSLHSLVYSPASVARHWRWHRHRQVESGMETLRLLEALPVDDDDRPLKPVRIVRCGQLLTPPAAPASVVSDDSDSAAPASDAETSAAASSSSDRRDQHLR